jgi:hypothetical protein
MLDVIQDCKLTEILPAPSSKMVSFVYGGSTMHCFIRMNSNNVCGAGGTTAAVIKVLCLCDVSCSLAMEQEILQRNFSRTDVRTLIKYHVLMTARMRLE